MILGASSGRSEELWLFSLMVASAAVVVIGILFGLVIAALQRIDRHSARTHAAAKQIAQNTVALWALDQLNRDLVAIRDAARGAEAQRAGAVTSPLATAAQKVQGLLAKSEQQDDKSS